MAVEYTCDLEFSFASTDITPSSTPSVADGSVQVTANSVDSVRYSISSSSSPTDPSYASRTNTSGIFTGLVAGSYIVNARTNDSCKKEITIIITYALTWVPRWRVQHATSDTSSKLKFRIDIEDNQYTGDISDVWSNGDPEILEHINDAGDDVFEPVVGSQLTINLISPTDGYFDIINGYDEKRFRLTYYVDFGNGYVRAWQGFVVPQNSDEDYNREIDYDVHFTFSDGLSDLKNRPFTDDSGNNISGRISILSGIIFCLNKTSLQLPIWETINIYEIAMSHGANDSTLTQCYFDPEVYLQNDGTMEDCLTVLKSLIRNFGARLIQSNGRWCIDLATLKSGTLTDTRKFDYKGSFISAAQEPYRVLLRQISALSPKICFEERSAFKSHQNMYGSLNFTFDYGLKSNVSLLIDGDFEDDDVGAGQLMGWQVDPTNAPTLRVYPDGIDQAFWRIETIDGNKVFIADTFMNVVGLDSIDESFLVTSKPVTLYSSPTDSLLKLSFDINLTPTAQISVDYVRFDYAIIGSNGYAVGDFNSSDGNLEFGLTPISRLVDGKYFRSFVTQLGSSTTIEKTINLPSSIVGLLGDVQVQFRISTNPLWDYIGLVTGVPALADANYPDFQTQGDVKKIAIASGTELATFPEWDGFLFFYDLEPLTDTSKITSLPDYIVPNSGNPLIESAVWVLKKTSQFSDSGIYRGNDLLSSVTIDNVILKYLPNETDALETDELTVVINENVKNPLEITFRHGDLPVDSNYRNIMQGYLSLSDGTPTFHWKFKGLLKDPPFNSEYPLLRFLQTLIYRLQYADDRWRLSGSVLCLEVIPFIGMSVYEVRTGRIYTIVSSSIMGKGPTAQIRMIETLKGVPLVDEGADPDPDVEPPSGMADFSAIDFSDVDFNAV